MFLNHTVPVFSLLLLAACSSDKDDTACADDGVYRDGDGDGYIEEHEFDGCTSVPAELVDRLGDCDDVDPDVHPEAEDVPGDGIDQDCDGLDATASGTEDSAEDTGGGDTGEDTGGDTGEVTDSDHDGSPDDLDCDPYDDDVFPDAVETCDGVDNDCDGEIDEDAADASTWCVDADGDGYGDPAISTTACEAPSGYITDCSDIDDSSTSNYPGSTAVDDDGDGYSDDAGDCDDTDRDLSPGAAEVCTGDVDEDCDGLIDHDDPDCPIDIDIACADPIVTDTTWGGATYTVEDGCILEVTGGATLTIEAGTTVLFGTDSGLLVGDADGGGGRLVVEGTTDPDSTVTFSSSRPGPRAGDYYGVMLAADDLGSEITGLALSYAGADGTDGSLGWSGALSIVSTNAPEISDSAITDSAAAGIYLDDASVVLSGLSLTGNEADGLRVTSGAEPEISGSTFAENELYGIYIERGSGLAGSSSASGFTDNKLYDNGIFPIALPVASVPLLDRSNTFTESGVATDADRIHVLGGDVTRTGTWCAHDAPYDVQDNINVGDTDSTPILYIEGGAQLYFGTSELFVGNYGQTGALVLPAPDGHACSDDPPEGQVLFSGGSGWTGIFLSSYSSDSSMDNFRVEGATGEGVYVYVSAARLSNFEIADTIGTGLRVSGSSGTEMAVVKDFEVTGSTDNGVKITAASTVVSDCVISDNGGDGILVESDGYYASPAAPSITDCTIEDNDGAGLNVTAEKGCCIDIDELADNTISGNGGVPAHVPPDVVEKLAENTIIADTGEPYVEVEAGTMDEDATWYDLGLPYHVLGDVVFGKIGHSLEWTLEPGTELLMDGGVTLEVGYSDGNVLTAEGSTGAPVVFDAYDTSWAGLYLYQSTAHLDWTTITGAGDDTYTASCGVASAICCTSCTLNMTDSTVAADEGYGLYCTGTPDVSVGAGSDVLGDGSVDDTYGCD